MPHASDEIAFLSAEELARQYRAGELSPIEVTRTLLHRIDAFAVLNAFYEVDGEGALAAARAAEVRYRGGEPLSPLDGVPVSIKDHIAVRGMRTVRGGYAASSEPDSVDSPVAARLREAGAVILGKTTMPELSVIPETASAAYGITRNPWDLERTPGGSSGGAAAAVAAGLGPIAIGSDGGGSIRIPASFTGVVGLKPTHGAIPYWPAPTDRTVVGPLTRTVADAAIVMDAVAVPDGRDWTEVEPADGSYFGALSSSLAGLHIAYSPTFGFARVDPPVADCVRGAVERLGAAFAKITEIETICRPADEAYLSIATLRLHKLHPPEPVPPAVAAVLRYAQAVDRDAIEAYFTARDALATDLLAVFQDYDVIVSPVAPVTAPALGAFYPAGDPLSEQGRNLIAFTCPANLVHLPALSIPCGFAGGLPVGLQLLGPKGSEPQLLALASACEQIFGVGEAGNADEIYRKERES